MTKKKKSPPKFSISDHTASKLYKMVQKMIEDPRFKSPFNEDGTETAEYKAWIKNR